MQAAAGRAVLAPGVIARMSKRVDMPNPQLCPGSRRRIKTALTLGVRVFLADRPRLSQVDVCGVSTDASAPLPPRNASTDVSARLTDHAATASVDQSADK